MYYPLSTFSFYLKYRTDISKIYYRAFVVWPDSNVCLILLLALRFDCIASFLVLVSIYLLPKSARLISFSIFKKNRVSWLKLSWWQKHPFQHTIYKNHRNFSIFSQNEVIFCTILCHYLVYSAIKSIYSIMVREKLFGDPSILKNTYFSFFVLFQHKNISLFSFYCLWRLGQYWLYHGISNYFSKLLVASEDIFF